MSKSKYYYHPQSDFFRRFNMPAPSTISHGLEEDIKEKLTELKPNSWRLEGNKLIGETEMGPLVNFIPTNYILEGTDDNGLPIFRNLDE